MEIVTKEEDKVIIEYMKDEKMWKIEHVSVDGYVKMDFHNSLSKNIRSLPEVQHMIIRRRSLDDERRQSLDI